MISVLANPYLFAWMISSFVHPAAARRFSMSTIFLIFSKKNGVMEVSWTISSIVKPSRKASKRQWNRSSVGRDKIIRISLGLVWDRTSVSSDRLAFMKDSSRVRPIAITSPVLFMEVESVRSAPLNLSNGQRGILTTM